MCCIRQPLYYVQIAALRAHKHTHKAVRKETVAQKPLSEDHLIFLQDLPSITLQAALQSWEKPCQVMIIWVNQKGWERKKAWERKPMAPKGDGRYRRTPGALVQLRVPKGEAKQH